MINIYRHLRPLIYTYPRRTLLSTFKRPFHATRRKLKPISKAKQNISSATPPNINMEKEETKPDMVRSFKEFWRNCLGSVLVFGLIVFSANELKNYMGDKEKEEEIRKKQIKIIIEDHPMAEGKQDHVDDDEDDDEEEMNESKFISEDKYFNKYYSIITNCENNVLILKGKHTEGILHKIIEIREKNNQPNIYLVLGKDINSENLTKQIISETKALNFGQLKDMILRLQATNMKLFIFIHLYDELLSSHEEDLKANQFVFQFLKGLIHRHQALKLIFITSSTNVAISSYLELFKDLYLEIKLD